MVRDLGFGVQGLRSSVWGLGLCGWTFSLEGSPRFRLFVLAANIF